MIEHVRELQTRWNGFFERAYTVKSRDDLETQERIWYLAYAFPIPDWVPLIAGDAVHCLRCALDHLIYRLVWVHTNGKGPFSKNLYFPVGSDITDFNRRLEAAAKYKTKSTGMIPTLGPEAIKALETLQPYQGGRSAILWHIHSLDIIDKHHLLLTIDLNNATHSMTPEMIAEYKIKFRLKDDYSPLEEALLFQTDSSALFPLNSGNELARVPITKANQNMRFSFDVAFGEPEIVRGKSIAPFLYQASGFIRDIIRTFESSGIL